MGPDEQTFNLTEDEQKEITNFYLKIADEEKYPKSFFNKNDEHMWIRMAQLLKDIPLDNQILYNIQGAAAIKYVLLGQDSKDRIEQEQIQMMMSHAGIVNI